MSDRKGEGSYDGAEKFQKEERDFVKSGQVPQKAREAADALDSEEAEERAKRRPRARPRKQLGRPEARQRRPTPAPCATATADSARPQGR
jgi:hypothetical protein